MEGLYYYYYNEMFCLTFPNCLNRAAKEVIVFI